MSEFLTTRELAALLRVKERKVYDLVAKGSLPVRRVTGKLLFPRAEIETWMGGLPSSEEVGADQARATAHERPMIFAGGHDVLLEWVLRESRSGIAAFLDGALDGLARAAAGECMAAGLHIPEEGGEWNVATVAERFGAESCVLIEWARRERGLILGRGLKRSPRCLAETRGLRFQHRQREAGSELVLDRLLAAEGLTRSDLSPIQSVERSESDLAMAVASGRAEVGLGIRAAATLFGLDFVPLVEERFDILVWRWAYFEPPFQRFVQFCLGSAFRARAAQLGGYDVSGFGKVHFNGA